MRRTQLYLPDDLWTVLHTEAKAQGTTLSDLVRKAVDKEYGVLNRERRKAAMKTFVGIRGDQEGDIDTYVRGLREDDRLDRLNRE